MIGDIQQIPTRDLISLTAELKLQYCDTWKRMVWHNPLRHDGER